MAWPEDPRKVKCNFNPLFLNGLKDAIENNEVEWHHVNVGIQGSHALVSWGGCFWLIHESFKMVYSVEITSGKPDHPSLTNAVLTG